MRLTRKPPIRYGTLLCARRYTVPPRVDQPLWCATGRGGLELAAMALGLHGGQAVLLPAYICDVALIPLEQLGLRPLWYGLKADLSPCWDEIQAKISQTTAALLMHPFGQPQDATRFASLCEAAGVFFLEDNAHGYGASLQGKLLGTWGDAGIASPWKQYPIPHGACVWFREEENAMRARTLYSQWSDASLPMFKPWCRSSVRKLLALFPSVRRAILAPPHGASDLGETCHKPPERIHPAVRAALRSVAPVQDAAQRREIYDIWHRWLQRTNLRPVFPTLVSEAAPLCFPVYAPNESIRNRWLAWGWQYDIAVHTWPELPLSLRTQPEAMARWQVLLCFPIHQQMSPSRLHSYLDSLPRVD